MRTTIRTICTAAAALSPHHAVTWVAIASLAVGPGQVDAGTGGDHHVHLDEVSAVTPTPAPDDGPTDDLPESGGTEPATPDLAPDATPEETPEDPPAGPDVDAERPSGDEQGSEDERSSLSDAFVATALAQRGDSYVFGAEAGLDDPDPDAFDSSELVQWAAHQVGVTIPDGAMYQYLELKARGQLASVEEALHTKGALLFYFSSEPTPGGGRPGVAHVAISLGDGRTIEARGSADQVKEFPAADRFNYAGTIPEMTDPLPDGHPTTEWDFPTDAPLDSDGDGLSDVFERTTGSDPFAADDPVEDAFTAYPDAFDLLGADPLRADGGRPEAEPFTSCPPVKPASTTRRAGDGFATHQVAGYRIRLTIREIYAYALSAGFTPDQATTWTAIALAESGGETGARDGSGRWGLWQIRVGFHRPNTWGDLHDPLVNARAAYEISLQGTDMRPWSVTHRSHAGTSTDYRTYLAAVSAVTGHAGDRSGTKGYDLPCP